jgi:tRNA(Ile)-lysidine synthase
MNLLNTFTKHWQKEFNQWPVSNCHLLLAVSGGVDSVVMTDLFYQAGFNFTIVHCNFQLRGEVSDSDAMFVKALGEKYEKEVIVKEFDTANYAAENKIAIQEAARNLRYNWFQEVLVQKKAAYLNKAIGIVTAHHANDNIETVLMHFFRGTGVHGLRGILPIQKDRSIVRPLLLISKESLIEYANEYALDFVEDQSNTSDKYSRNFFRNQLIPQIKTVYPQVLENILHNIDRFKDVSLIYEEAMAQKLKTLLLINGNEFQVPIVKLKKTNTVATIVWEIIKQFGFSAQQITEVVKLLDSNDNGANVFSATHRIIRNRNWLIIATLETENAKHIIVEKIDKKTNFQLGILQFRLYENTAVSIASDKNTAQLNAENLAYPLIIRPYKTGDYFYPLGMQKKKKLSKFFIDQKLSKTDKEKIWVIESSKKIVWVIGFRIDNRFKITPATKQLLSIQFKAN